MLPFMPSVSTVGIVAANFHVLERAMRVLLCSPAEPECKVRKLLLLDDAFRLSDEAVRSAAEQATVGLSERAGVALERVSISQIVGSDFDLAACNTAALRQLQTLEFQNTVGDWIENQEPKLGHTFSLAYQNVKQFDRTKAIEALERCERIFGAFKRFLQPGTVVCFPSTPTVAPLLGSLTTMDAVVDFYDRTMAVTSFSGVGRLPEISAPVLTVDGCPVGLSLAVAHYQDEFLLRAARTLLVAER